MPSRTQLLPKELLTSVLHGIETFQSYKAGIFRDNFRTHLVILYVWVTFHIPAVILSAAPDYGHFHTHAECFQDYSALTWKHCLASGESIKQATINDH